VSARSRGRGGRHEGNATRSGSWCWNNVLSIFNMILILRSTASV
jgi:hypothetical protein